VSDPHEIAKKRSSLSTSVKRMGRDYKITAKKVDNGLRVWRVK